MATDKEQSLVERLRDLVAAFPDMAEIYEEYTLATDAADRIELLERQLALCKSQRNNEITSQVNVLSFGMENQIAVYDAELAALERTGKP